MKAPRHLILISVDALRFDAISGEPSRHYLKRFGMDELSHTPNLDYLARTGFQFHACRTVAPLTTPSHAAMLTGLYPPKSGVRLMVSERVSEERKTLAERFRERGFATFSSIDADPVFKLAGLHRGFETTYSVDTADEQVLEDFRRVDRARGRAFLFFHMNDVHYPYGLVQRPVRKSENKEFFRDFLWLADRAGLALTRSQRRELKNGSTQELSRHRTRLMDRMLENGTSASLLFPRYLHGVNRFDEGRFSRLLEGLKKRRLLSNSLVVITADHGEALLPDLHVPENYRPMKGQRFGHCHCVVDELLRVPLIFWSDTPGFRKGSSDLPVSIVDIAPTLASIFGIRSDASSNGVDRSPLLSGKRRGRANTPSDSYAEAWHEDWKATKHYLNRIAPLTVEGEIEGPLPKLSGSPVLYQQTLRQGPLKLVLTRDSVPALYHTDRDPFETVNLLEYGDEFRALGKLLQKKLSRLGKMKSTRVSRSRRKPPRKGRGDSNLLSQLEMLGYL